MHSPRTLTSDVQEEFEEAVKTSEKKEVTPQAVSDAIAQPVNVTAVPAPNNVPPIIENIVDAPPSKTSKAAPSLRVQTERVGDFDIKGWIADKGQPNKIFSVIILCDGKPVDTIVANIARGDLRSAGYGHGNHGFVWRPTAEIRDGKRRIIRLKVDEAIIDLPGAYGEGVAFQRPIEVVGGVDSISGRAVLGWACNKLDPEEPIFVSIEVDSHVVDTVAVKSARKDVEQSKRGPLISGFSWTVPTALCNGRRHVIRCLVAGVPLPPFTGTKDGLLFSVDEKLFFKKDKPREFQFIPPGAGGLPDYFPVRVAGPSKKALVFACVETPDDWAELDKIPFDTLFTEYNVIIATRSNLAIDYLSTPFAGCDKFFLVEYESNISIMQVFLHTVNANAILDYSAICVLMPSLARDGELESFARHYDQALLDENIGLVSAKFARAGTVLNEPMVTLLKTVLPRLGCAVDHLKFNVPIGAAFYLNAMLLRHVAALPLQLRDFDSKTKTPVDWFGLIKSLLGFFAEQGGYETATDVRQSPSALTGGGRTIKAIAFLLPQFHLVAENDSWWGKGFTEWNNVIRGKPLFRAHYQPRLPKDLGFYDLRHPDTQRRQAELAKEHGLYGFCYYYYWFDGKKMLNEPIEQMLNSGSPDYPFCVCWANENWSRNWDGQDRFLLLKQNYTPESNRAIISEFIKMMRDPRYIRHNGKPVLIIYRIRIIPNWLRVAAMWREECRKAGIGEIHLCAVRFGLEPLEGPPAEFGLDAYVLFPPHETQRDDIRSKMLDLNGAFNGEIFTYDGVVAGDLKRFDEKYSWHTHRGAMMGWDNTARRLTDARIFHGATPLKFRRWLKGIVEQEIRHNKEETSLLFINAWNEWAEGTTLEPDQKFGDSYLRAVRSTIGRYAPVWKVTPQRALPKALLTSVVTEFQPTSRATATNLMKSIKGDVEFKLNRPTIMLCAHVSGHQLFGGERSFLDIVNALYKLDYNVVVCLPSANNKEYVSIIRHKVKYIHVFHYPQWNNKRDVDQFVVLNFSDVIARHNVTLVYANTIVLLEPLIAAKRMGRARLVHTRELISLDAAMQEYLGMSAPEIIADVFEKSDFIIANSMATYNLFARQDRTFYVPNAVNIDDFPTENSVQEKIRFGIVSSNIPKKGVADFVEVAAYCAGKTDKAEFVVIGPENKQIEAWRKDPSLPPNLRFLGYRETPIEAMKELNVLLSLSNFAESFGRTVAEAMVSYRPAITYEWGAVPEIIRHGVDGFLVPYRDIAATAEAVLKICQNPSLIATMGRAGRQNIVSRFSYTALERGLEDAMQGIFDKYGTADRVDKIKPSYMIPPAKLTVIIPVYNALEEVEHCIESVLKHTDMDSIKLLIINDASTEEGITKLLERYVGLMNVEVLHNPTNLGYTRNVNRGIKHIPSSDVILLNSDTVVTPNWIGGLRAAAFSSEKVGTVTGISDNAGAFSFPEMEKKNPVPTNFQPDDFAIKMVQAARHCEPIQVPTGSGFCMYISRRLMNEIGVFDEEAFARGYGEENDFCMRALKAGWTNLITPWCYVFHVRTASFKAEKDSLVKAGVDIVTKRYPNYASLVKEAFNSTAMQRLRAETKSVYEELV